MNNQKINCNFTLDQTFDKIRKGNKKQILQNKSYNLLQLTISVCLFTVTLLVGSIFYFKKQLPQAESSLNFDFSNQKLRNLKQANNIIDILKNSLINEDDDNQVTQLTIDLSQNQIEEDFASQIVHTLKNYKSLTILSINLSQNNLREVGGCKIVQALNAIQSLTTLNLDLSYNQIGDEGVVKIAEAFQNYKSLTNLSIDLFGNPTGDKGWSKALQIFNNYKFFFKIYSSLALDFKNQMQSIEYSEFISKIIDIFNSLTTFSDKNKFQTSLSIDLSQNQIGLNTAREIADALKDFQFLTSLSLNLSENNLGEEGASVIIEALVSNKSLIELRLDLNYNNIGDEGVIKIAEAFKNYLSLNEVQISLLGNPVRQRGWITLVKTMKEYKFLSKINSSLVLNFKFKIRDISHYMYMNKSYIQEAITILINCSKLTDNNVIISDLNLNLSSNNLNRNETEEIANVLKYYSQLTILNVDLSNNILEGNTSIITESLMNYESLNTLSLNLSGNKMSDIDIFNALQPLKKYQQLKSIQLNLSGNSICDQSLQIISELITQQKYLTTLDLNLKRHPKFFISYEIKGFCEAIEERIIKFSKAIKTQLYLTSLSIIVDSTWFYSKDLSYIVESFKLLQNLTILKLDINWISVDDYIAHLLSESLENLQLLTSFTFISGQSPLIDPLPIIKSLKKCKLLKYLSLDLETDVKIVDALKELTNLTSLDLNLQFRYFKDCETFLIALRDLSPLKNLQLSYLRQYKQGGNKLFQQFSQELFAIPFKNLISLNLYFDDCQLDDDGVQGLTYFLRNQKSLVSLFLYFHWNKIQIKGAKLIAESLDSLTELKDIKLYFYDNQMQDEGASYIVNSLMNHKKLANLQLSFSQNNLSEEGLIEIKKNINQLQESRGINAFYFY